MPGRSTALKMVVARAASSMCRVPVALIVVAGGVGAVAVVVVCVVVGASAAVYSLGTWTSCLA